MTWSNFVDPSLVASVVRALIPILLCALGGLLCDRVGVFNISLEGLLLVGCFFAVTGSYFTGSPYVGVLLAVVASTAVSGVLAFGAVTRKADPIIMGVALNIFAVGITGFLLQAIFDVRGVLSDPRIVGLPKIAIPGLSHIPWIGPALFNLTILGYVALLAVPALHVWLFKSRTGLRLRGVGERPLAAATLGVKPVVYQYGAVLFSGVLCGLAGAQLSLGNVVQFTENMSGGRGWIAVVAVMLARANPVGTLGAALLFGLTEALGYRLQGLGLPQQITEVAPYVVTFIALLLARKQFRRGASAVAAA